MIKKRTIHWYFPCLVVIIKVFFLSYVFSSPSFALTKSIPFYTYQIIHEYPHDKDAFTEGLVLEDGVLYEGTGLYGHSTLRKVELDTGKILQIHHLPSKYFGEGITIYQDKIIQLTWKSYLGFVYDKFSFNLIKEFNYYPYEGWGITYDGRYLIMSDGTSVLHFFDPETFQEVKKLEVSANDFKISKINELEYIHGEIYANIWLTDYIARINPLTGLVVGWIDLKDILERKQTKTTEDVLNGIAYDEENGELLVTGKFWPKLFGIKIESKEGKSP